MAGCIPDGPNAIREEFGTDRAYSLLVQLNSRRDDVEPELESVEHGNKLGELFGTAVYLDVTGRSGLLQRRFSQDDLIQVVAGACVIVTSVSNIPASSAQMLRPL